MLTIDIKRSVAALAVTAGLLAAAAPASHGATPKNPSASASYVFEDVMISGDVKAKTAKRKRGGNKPTHTYDIRVDRG
jgi:hypothetical protein